MTMQFVAHSAPDLGCVSASGSARSIANKMAFGSCVPTCPVQARANKIEGASQIVVGRVHALGTWRDPAVCARLGTALGATLAPALRTDFEWYICRGAFFHNDAHYDGRLFGIWCIAGPPAELVFPRSAVRLDAGPGSISVFDPFEVHGVLAPGRTTYAAGDYQDAEASLFVGFELDIAPAIAAAFGIKPGIHGRAISSRTRIVATDGALDSAS